MKIAIALWLCAALPAMADEPSVVAAAATPGIAGWTIDVTIAHPDTGWDHYADAWEVLSPGGASLGVRELAHPHETEQPFTRSLSGVALPPGADHVLIRTRCLVDGWGTARFRVDLPR
jgi:hypothetical protein